MSRRQDTLDGLLNLVLPGQPPRCAVAGCDHVYPSLTDDNHEAQLVDHQQDAHPELS